MIVSIGPRRAALAVDVPSAAFVAASVERDTFPAVGDDGEAVRVVVEVLRQHGGMAPRALIGGKFEPGGTDLLVDVSISERGKERRTCRSQLGRRLVPGLPSEFAWPVFDGLRRAAKLPAGQLTVDRAGYDPVESSPLMFE